MNFIRFNLMVCSTARLWLAGLRPELRPAWFQTILWGGFRGLLEVGRVHSRAISSTCCLLQVLPCSLSGTIKVGAEGGQGVGQSSPGASWQVAASAHRLLHTGMPAPALNHPLAAWEVSCWVAAHRHHALVDPTALQAPSPAGASFLKETRSLT